MLAVLQKLASCLLVLTRSICSFAAFYSRVPSLIRIKHPEVKPLHLRISWKEHEGVNTVRKSTCIAANREHANSNLLLSALPPLTGSSLCS